MTEAGVVSSFSAGVQCVLAARFPFGAGVADGPRQVNVPG
jgi:hypothetical protein